MTIGEVARAAGLRASAIRYYEDAGLLPPPQRAEAKAIGLRRKRIERALECRCADFGECGRRILARKKSEGL